MLFTWLDIAFVAVGLTVVAYGFWHRKSVPMPTAPPQATRGELMLTLLALVPAAIGPNILVIALTPGMPAMPTLVRFALLPSLALLLVVWVAAWVKGYERLVNRIEAGVWVGFFATAALDAFRLASFQFGLLPGNLPRMFGVLIFDRMALGPSAASDLVGSLYHYWVSASFGIAYTLLLGRTRWWGGLIWGLVIEVGMMTTPPMVVAMGTGYFGLAAGNGLLNGVFIGSLVPHISYGIVLGVLLERYVAHRGTLLSVLRGVMGRSHVHPVPKRSHADR